MRIISGKFKSRAIKPVPSKHTRPTTDRVREAWASTLATLTDTNDFEGLKVLDAFAGSGALGLELLSRGAASCYFVEKNRAASGIVKENIRSLGLTNKQAKVEVADSLSSSLSSGFFSNGPFDLVVLDPPYEVPLDQVQAFIERLIKAQLLSYHAVISYEHASSKGKGRSKRNESDSLTLANLELVRSKEYGTICIDYFVYC